MRILRKLFVDHTALVLLLPFSLCVGLYVFKNHGILSLEVYYPFLYFYIFFALLPLFFLFFRSRSDLGSEVLDVVKNFLERFLPHKWVYVIIVLVFSLFFLYMASIHISTYFERDQWILENSIPILPIDMIILPRLALVVSWFVPIDIAIPLVNLIFIAFWFCFLIYIIPAEKYAWVDVLLVFSFTFLTSILHLSLYASFEFPSAMVSFIGMYGIWKRKYSLGLFLLIMGGVFKNTGLLHVVTGGFLLVFVLWLDNNLNFKKIRGLIDVSLVLFLGFYFILSYWGLFYYIFADRGDAGYIVTADANKVDWLLSVSIFIIYLFRNYAIIFFLGIIGVLLTKDKKYLAAFSVGLLLTLRGFLNIDLAGDSYSVMFVPGLSFFALIGVSNIWVFLSQKWVRFILSILLLALNLNSFRGIVNFVPGGMNHRNSNFDEFVAKLARRFPDDGYIYQKDISIVPYLKEARGGDLDAIRFRPFPELKQEALSELSLLGCKLIIISRADLADIGVSEKDFANMGYSEHPYVLADSSENWLSYSKECNAWEYE